MNASSPLPAAGSEPVSWPVNVGTAARLAGLSSRMVRHYEALGLLGGIARSEGGYRRYGENDVHTLRFIQRSRRVGFGMEQIAELLNLWRDKGRSSAQVKRLAEQHAADLAQRIAAMQAMQHTLAGLIHACHGDQRPDCPILDTLAGTGCCHTPPLPRDEPGGL